MKTIILIMMSLLSVNAFAAPEHICEETEDDLINAILAYNDSPGMELRAFLKTPIGKTIRSYGYDEYVLITYSKARSIWEQYDKTPKSQKADMLDYYLDKELWICSQVEL